MDAWMLVALDKDTPHTMAKHACEVARSSQHTVYFIWHGVRVELGPSAKQQDIEKRLEEVRDGRK